MQLRNTEIFCDVVTHRSFSRAAEARSISQPAASQAIQQLEDVLGTTLIDRSKRPFELTPAGELYFEESRKLLEAFRRIEDKVQRFGDRVSGRVRVASIYSVGLLQMTEYVQRFATTYPDVQVHLDYLHPDKVYERVRHEECELGIVSFPRDGGDVSSIRWQMQPMGVVVPLGHRLSEHEAVSLEDLAGEAFVAFSDDLRIRRQIDRCLKRAGVSVTVIHQFDNVENIKRAVEIGAGISILPLPTVRREVAHQFLAAIPFRDRDLVRPLGIIHRRHKYLSTAAEKFVELLQEQPAVDDSDTSLVPLGSNGKP